jgi:anti-anti-sigma factor
MTLKIETYVRGDVMVLRCTGRLVGEEGIAALREAAEKLLSEGRGVIISLTGVDHIDSTGLAAIVHLLTQKRDLGGQARLVSSSEYLADLLGRTRLDTVFTVYASEEEAVASFAQRPSDAA